jgi:hypothetical protein
MDVFMSVYGENAVKGFFKWLDSIVMEQQTIDNFCKYHTKEMLTSFMDLFPPPDLIEIWLRWNKLERPLK